MVARRFLTAFFALCAMLMAGGCSFDAADGTKFAGQRCFDDTQCAAGLACVERVCRPIGGGGGGGSDTGGVSDTGGGDDTGVDTGVDPDAPVVCEPNSRRCIGDAGYQTCTPDGSGWRDAMCPDETVCRDGECVIAPGCQDRDGDTYGDGCRRGPDCDDSNPDVHPERAEDCSTPYDDNCNRQINEECDACCAGGCADGEFCEQCQCRPFDPEVCEYQLQPCETEGQNNGFYCTDFGDGRRCLAICDKTVDDPASTCPNPNSQCVFGDERQGVCLSGCSLERGCGADDLGCLPYGDGSTSEGMCVPTNDDNELGDRCDAEAFFDCEEGAICLEFGRQGARCVPACRPFAGPGTDCPDGEGYCIPFDRDLGMCRPSIQQTEGESCSRREIYQTCSEDSVGCFPGGGNGAQCFRFCRLGIDYDDCVDPGTRCNRYDQNQDQLGMCY